MGLSAGILVDLCVSVFCLLVPRIVNVLSTETNLSSEKSKYMKIHAAFGEAILPKKRTDFSYPKY